MPVSRPSFDYSRRAAGLLAVGFEGTQLTHTLRDLIDRGVAGVVLFSRNIETPRQVASLVRAIKQHAGRPIYVGIDQEGGVVQRLRSGFTRIPDMRSLGRTGDETLAYGIGQVLGRELRAVGIDVDFAPVLDVDTNPNNPVIGNRSLSDDPSVVSRLGVALGRGIESCGVAACGKHFPGHGDTELDSHLALPVLRHDMERLNRVELNPFFAWSKNQLASVMTAHVVFSALDPELPATMSKPALKGVLREQMGYDGLVISDDLEMKAIVDHFGVKRAAVMGFIAGVDQFLVCRHAEVAKSVIDALAEAAEAGTVSPERFAEALSRNEGFLARWACPAGDFVEQELASTEAQALVQRVLAQAAEPTVERVDPTERPEV